MNTVPFMAIARNTAILPIFRVPVDDEYKQVRFFAQDFVGVGQSNPAWVSSMWKPVHSVLPNVQVYELATPSLLPGMIHNHPNHGCIARSKLN